MAETGKKMSDLPGLTPAMRSVLARRGIRCRPCLEKRPETWATLPADIRAVLENPVKMDIPGDVAADISEDLVRLVRFGAPRPDGSRKTIDVRNLVAVGGVRRKRATMKDIDLLAVVADGDVTKIRPGTLWLAPAAKHRGYQLMLVSGGDRKLFIILRRGRTNYHVDLFVATESEKPFALFHFTGSKVYNIRTRRKAKLAGLLLNQYGLYRTSGDASRRRRLPGIRTERDIADRLGISYRPPEDREG